MVAGWMAACVRESSRVASFDWAGDDVNWQQVEEFLL